jgi:hypothetical protein
MHRAYDIWAPMWGCGALVFFQVFWSGAFSACMPASLAESGSLVFVSSNRPPPPAPLASFAWGLGAAPATCLFALCANFAHAGRFRAQPKVGRKCSYEYAVVARSNPPPPPPKSKPPSKNSTDAHPARPGAHSPMLFRSQVGPSLCRPERIASCDPV